MYDGQTSRTPCPCSNSARVSDAVYQGVLHQGSYIHTSSCDSALRRGWECRRPVVLVWIAFMPAAIPGKVPRTDVPCGRTSNSKLPGFEPQIQTGRGNPDWI